MLHTTYLHGSPSRCYVFGHWFWSLLEKRQLSAPVRNDGIQSFSMSCFALRNSPALVEAAKNSDLATVQVREPALLLFVAAARIHNRR